VKTAFLYDIYIFKKKKKKNQCVTSI